MTDSSANHDATEESERWRERLSVPSSIDGLGWRYKVRSVSSAFAKCIDYPWTINGAHRHP
jgi:hypothetical protein